MPADVTRRYLLRLIDSAVEEVELLNVERGWDCPTPTSVTKLMRRLGSVAPETTGRAHGALMDLRDPYMPCSRCSEYAGLGWRSFVARGVCGHASEPRPMTDRLFDLEELAS